MNTGEGIGTQDIGSKKRVYELAKELGVPNKDLVSKIQALGIEAKNHMSSLEADDVARIKRALDKERQENIVQERLTATVLRRRTKDGTAVAKPAAPAAAAAAPPATTTATPPPSGAVVRRRAVKPEVEEPVETPPAVEAHEHVEERPEEEAPARVEARRPAHVEEEKEEPVVEAPRHVEAHKPVEPVRHEPPAPAVEAPEPTPPAPVEARPEPTPPARPVEPARPAATATTTAAPMSTATPAAPSAGDGRAEPSTGPGPIVETRRPSQPDRPQLGPTGRVIDLSTVRPPVIQITQQQPGARRGVEVREIGRTGSGRREPERFGRQPHGKKKAVAGKKQKQTQLTTPAAHKRIIKMEETIAVNEIARQMGIKATDVLKKLWGMGLTGITMNSAIDQDSAGLVAQEFGFEIENVAFQEQDVFGSIEDKAEDLEGRAPVVTIMGHVDHGKTSLLDAIRNANVAAGEAGGITQHIGAYKVSADNGDVVFLDTPGHEAFTAMRARGAQATDIVVLVVAADDGVMPTTLEALNHAKQAGVPIVVAVNKIDKPNAQPDRVRQQLSDHGLVPEAWGGETIYVDVSARNKTGVDQLLEMLALQAEVLELKANPNKLAKGLVIEAKLDRNRGPVSTVLVQEGSLKIGDTIVAGEQVGKVRAMLDDKGRNVTTAGPSTPVEVLGLSGVPNAGEQFNAVSDEKAAKEVVDHRRDTRRKKELSAASGKVTLENVFAKIKEEGLKELKIVLKADVQGSAEALKDALVGLTTEQVKVDVIYAGVGGITESDINLAKAGNAIVVGFHVRPTGKAAQLAEQDQVDIKLYEIIYEALDDVKKAMAGLLAPVRREKWLGQAEVRQTFSIPKIGVIAGCGVTQGTIKRSAQVRLVRDSVQVWQGKLASLRRFKDDVREVQQGYECGIGLEGYNDLKIGDVIEAFEIEEVAATL